jgi:hypothetical protein
MEAASSTPIELLGVNPKHPDAPTTLSPEEAMEQARAAIHDWNETVLPKIRPIVEDLWHQANDLWQVEKHEFAKQDLKVDLPAVDDIPHQFQGAWQSILSETAALQMQVDDLKMRLVKAKENIHHTLQVDPECAKYMSAILKLPFFSPPCPEALKELDHYYNYKFLHQYENAMVEYEEMMGYPTGLLRRIENIRKYEVQEVERHHQHKDEKKKSLLHFL